MINCDNIWNKWILKRKKELLWLFDKLGKNNKEIKRNQWWAAREYSLRYNKLDLWYWTTFPTFYFAIINEIFYEKLIKFVGLLSRLLVDLFSIKHINKVKVLFRIYISNRNRYIWDISICVYL